MRTTKSRPSHEDQQERLTPESEGDGLGSICSADSAGRPRMGRPVVIPAHSPTRSAPDGNCYHSEQWFAAGLALMKRGEAFLDSAPLDVCGTDAGHAFVRVKW